jgi:hypothetical protein
MEIFAIMFSRKLGVNLFYFCGENFAYLKQAAKSNFAAVAFKVNVVYTLAAILLTASKLSYRPQAAPATIFLSVRLRTISRP